MTLLMRHIDDQGYATEHYRVRRSNGDLFGAIQKLVSGRYNRRTGAYESGPIEWVAYTADLNAGYHTNPGYGEGQPVTWQLHQPHFRTLKAATAFVLDALAEIEPPVNNEPVSSVPTIVIDGHNDPDNGSVGSSNYCEGCGDIIYSSCQNDDNMCDYCCSCC